MSDVPDASVGQAYASLDSLTIAHPVYTGLVGVVQDKLSNAAAARGLARVRSKPVFSFVSLDSASQVRLQELYPELRLLDYGTLKPAHSFFVQSRRCAMEWVLLQAERYGSTAYVCGGDLVPALQSSFDSVALAVDEASPVAVHERYQATLLATRLYKSQDKVAADAGVVLDRARYAGFLCGQGVGFCRMGSRSETPDVLCVDGGLYGYSPWQVAQQMDRLGVDLAFGYTVYHPEMLINSEGVLPGLGVHYARTSSSVSFKYPEGQSGVSSMSVAAWQAWLTAHSFSIAPGRSYQLELLKVRGAFLFYRIVAVSSESTLSGLVHALDVGGREPQYVVRSWRLKALGLDPTKRKNWEPHMYVVNQRPVDRVYLHGMQVDKKSFNQGTVRKQLYLAGGRRVVGGTGVVVNDDFPDHLLDTVSVDLTARIFVDRYESGTLSEEARKFIDYYSWFSSQSRARKVWVMITFFSTVVWEYTGQLLDGLFRRAADAVLNFLNPDTGFLKTPVFDVSPDYVLLNGRCVNLDGGRNAARELSRRAALNSQGWMAAAARYAADVMKPVGVSVRETVFNVSEFALFDTVKAQGSAVDAVWDVVAALNPVDVPSDTRRALTTEIVARDRQEVGYDMESFGLLDDPVSVLNEFYDKVVPGVAQQNLEFDSASLSLDPQDRVLTARRMVLPPGPGEMPRPREYYHSKLRALNVPKRQQTLQELLSAVTARNLNAPQLALPEDMGAKAVEVWALFKKKACVDDVDARLLGFQMDPVGIEEDGFREWVSQATTDKLQAVRLELEEENKALEEMPVNEYLLMLKADVKPTLSTKPIDQRTDPQVIVFHRKALSALYSSMYRCLARRFLSILRPNYCVNLLKDMGDVVKFIQGVHPFGATGLRYLENDFSKYDKSQGEFAMALEQIIFQQLGLNESFLQQWVQGHVHCRMRSLALGLSLDVMYQRKSGDATTAFGNVVLNIVSVVYAYKDLDIVWAVFQGDDSVLCVQRVGDTDLAVRVLAEVFNLSAKTYLTDAPYYASNFIVLDNDNRVAAAIPDPVKRVERWSMMVSAEDPQWTERFVSARDSMAAYLKQAGVSHLPRLVAERYNVSVQDVAGVVDAVATIVSSEQRFRAVWHDKPELSLY